MDHAPSNGTALIMLISVDVLIPQNAGTEELGKREKECERERLWDSTALYQPSDRVRDLKE